MSTFATGQGLPQEGDRVAHPLYGSVKGTPFQRDTITSEEVPRPNVKWPGAASARAATLWARRAGPRVYAGMMATPSCSAGVQAAARASGVKPSTPSVSADHTSV